MLLNETYPRSLSLQRLVVLDYLIVHSDDVPGGPPGLHPQVPHPGRNFLSDAMSYKKGWSCIKAAAYWNSALKLKGLLRGDGTDCGVPRCPLLPTTRLLWRDRARWLVSTYAEMEDDQLQAFAREHVGRWGAEFALESVLWAGTHESVGFSLRRLSLGGPRMVDAVVDFAQGLNVVAGPSDQREDVHRAMHRLHAQAPKAPKSIPEAQSYDL